MGTKKENKFLPLQDGKEEEYLDSMNMHLVSISKYTKYLSSQAVAKII